MWDHTLLSNLPPDRGDIPAFTPAEAGTQAIQKWCKAELT